MNLVEAYIDLQVGWDTSPKLEVLLTSEDISNRLYRYEEQHKLHWSLTGDYVSYFYGGYPDADVGFGGRHFSLPMADGGIHLLRGPWSGGSHLLNIHLPGEYVSTSWTTSLKDIERGYTLYGGGAITLEAAHEGVKAIDSGWDFIQKPLGEGYHYELLWNGAKPKPTKLKVISGYATKHKYRDRTTIKEELAIGTELEVLRTRPNYFVIADDYFVSPMSVRITEWSNGFVPTPRVRCYGFSL